jgi:hypothetical protein
LASYKDGKKVNLQGSCCLGIQAKISQKFREYRYFDMLITKDKYLAGLWAQVLEICRDRIGEHDFQYIEKFEDLAELLTYIREISTEYSNQMVPAILQRIEPCLERVQTFTTFMAIAFGGSNVQVGVFWGAVHLVIKVSRL